MHTFFHGWRRKAGCVTLVMALAVVGLWVRSRTTEDCFRFTLGDRQHRLSSTREYGLAWESWNSANPWNEEVVDMGHNRYQHVIHERPLVKESPHLGVALPLLVISAYLILWKPRKADLSDQHR